MPSIVGYSQAGVNRNQQRFGPDAIRRRLLGHTEAAGKAGIFSRGKNIYNGVSHSAHRGGGPQFGRPTGSKDVNRLKSAVSRRMAQQARFSGGGMRGY